VTLLAVFCFLVLIAYLLIVDFFRYQYELFTGRKTAGHLRDIEKGQQIAKKMEQARLERLEKQKLQKEFEIMERNQKLQQLESFKQQNPELFKEQQCDTYC
jgi:hypothetical protein